MTANDVTSITIASVSNWNRFASGTHARINLDAYEQNLEALADLVPPGTEFMAVVKADGYGHGAIECARAAERFGVSWIGVARIAEGLALRRNGVMSRILVIGPPPTSEVPEALRHDIRLSVGTLESFEAVATAARGLGLCVPVHLKIDTGMHRNGVLPEEALSIAQRIVGTDSVELEGVFTHFSSADEVDPAPTDQQIERFDRVVDELAAARITPRYLHLANSAAVLNGWIGRSNLVRCGIATYGLSPSPEVPVTDSFRPILSVHGVVARRSTLAPGEGVSYNLTYRTHEPEELALVTIGYADGLPRNLANQGWFGINGERCPIRGRVCMDQTVVHATASVKAGDSVVIIGDATSGGMSLDQIAALVGTNNYEVATRVMARVPRVYLRGGRPVAWEHLLLGERGTFED